MTDLISKIHKSDGKLVHVHPDRLEIEVTARPIRPMTEEEILAATMSDPDPLLLPPEPETKARPTPRANTIRRALGLTQEEFAARYLNRPGFAGGSTL